MAKKNDGACRQHYEYATTGNASGNPAPSPAEGRKVWDGKGDKAPSSYPSGPKPKSPF